MLLTLETHKGHSSQDKKKKEDHKVTHLIRVGTDTPGLDYTIKQEIQTTYGMTVDHEQILNLQQYLHCYPTQCSQSKYWPCHTQMEGFMFFFSFGTINSHMIRLLSCHNAVFLLFHPGWKTENTQQKNSPLTLLDLFKQQITPTWLIWGQSHHQHLSF